MTDTLQVVESFLNLEPGDILTKTSDGKYYECSVSETTDSADEENSFVSSYKSSTKISSKYAEDLLKNGMLSKVLAEKNEDKEFVNIFDEIDSLLDTYTKEKSSLDKKYAELPACLKVEADTVLSNMIKLLLHLKSLKK